MSGWTTKKLGEVCTFRRGLTYSKGDEVEHSSKVVLRANNISLEKNQLCFDELKFIRDDFEIPDDKYLEKDCLLICTASGSKAHLGKVAYIDKEYDFAFGGFMGLIVPDVSLVFSRYFYYVLTAENYRQFIQRLTDGANINNLKFSQLAEFDIPIPPLAEQKRIVAKIDAAFEKIDRLKANAEKNLANAKELFQSALDEAMRPKKGWEEKRLGEVYNFIDYRGKTPTKIDQGIPLVTARNIRMGYLDYSVRDFISLAEYKTRQSRGIAHKGDILFTTEAPLGFVALADLDEFSTGQRVITFQQYEGSSFQLLNAFYYYYFQAKRFQSEIRKQATGATAQGIKASRLRNIPIAVVPIAEQKQIIKHLDFLSEKIKMLEQNYARQVADCAEMRQAILREAFEGRL